MSLFEYGCSTTNKFSFLNANEEMEDPSEIFEQMTLQVAAAKEQAIKDAKSGKAAGAKKDASGKTIAGKGATTVGKDGKKQPLQQQIDNSTKAGGKTDELKKDTRQPKVPRTGANGDRKPATGEPRQNAPREGKENTSGSGGFGEFKQVRDQQPRRPRPEGEGGFRRDNNNQDGTRPPRRAPGSGGFGGDRPAGDRPFRPRTFRRTDEQGNELAPQGGEFGGNEDGGEGGFRRSGGGVSGGFRGPRPAGERREGGFNRGGERREGGFRPPRQSNDPDHPRTFDRHSGSERTGIKAVDKKEGAGKSNWGTFNDELVAEGDVATETQAGTETQTGDWAARVDENDEKKEGETTEGGEAGEVVPNFMTLDEYKALKNEINKKNAFNTRRAGEGEDQAKWKNTYVLPKKVDEDDEEEEDEEEEEEEEEEDEEELKKKSLLNQIQIKFYEPASKDRGDRGDRGDRRERTGGDRPPRREGDRPPRREGDRPQQRRDEATEAAVPSSAPDATAAPVEASPEKAARRTDNRGPQQGERRGGDRPQGDRRGPGGSGGQQSGQQRSGPAGPRNYQAKVIVPRIEDEKDFPSLGAK